MIVLASVASVGCGSTPPEDRYYSLVLEAADETAIERSDAAAQVVLSTLDLPAFLDSRAMAMQVGTNEIRAAQHHFWAEPLDEAIARVLARDIAIASDTVVLPGGNRGREGVCELRVQFDRFHATNDGRVLVSGRYSLGSAGGTEQRQFDVSQALAAGGYAGAVTTLRGAVGSLAREIAGEIAAAEDCRPPDPDGHAG